MRGPGERGSPEWNTFWDDLKLNYKDQYDAIRKNNNRWLFTCSAAEPAGGPPE